MKKNKNFAFKQRRALTRRGYSFVEMIIILVVLLILVLAASIAFVDLRAKSKETSENAIIASLQMAIKQYYSRFHVWPTQNPFTLMRYPPPFTDGWFGDCKETWGVLDEGGDWEITCPHYDPFYNCSSTLLGTYWKYFYTGVNTGRIILQDSNGH